MSVIYKPHRYQDFGTQHIIDNPFTGLFIDMGLGKTVMTLTATDYLIRDSFEVDRPLIVAPKKVAEHTWLEEIEKWTHLKHLRLSRIIGTPQQRIDAIKATADIYIIGRDNVEWLVTYFQARRWPYDMLIVDESSGFKNPTSKRFKALRMIVPLIKRAVIMTGTPAPNGLLDLWSQIYILDRGQRLGTTFPAFRSKYFVKENEYSPHSKHIVKEGDEDIGTDYYEKKILSKLSDICISMTAEDYLDLPKRIDDIKYIDLPDKMQKKYEDFERKLILELDDKQVTAANAAVLTNKLRQFTNGAIYTDSLRKTWAEVHNEKLEALEEEVEALNGKNVLIPYAFRHDLERMTKRFKHYKPILLKGLKEIKAWNDGNINMMFIHPQGAGHGLNIQRGGHNLLWPSLPWGWEYYIQTVKRLDRQGQEHAVHNRRILVRNTIDEDVLASLRKKRSKDQAVVEAVNVRKIKYKKSKYKKAV